MTLKKNIKFNKQQCEQLFQQYADQDSPNMITPDGTRQFFEDLELSIEDVRKKLNKNSVYTDYNFRF